MRRALVIVTLLCMSTAAWAQDVQVEFQSVGGTRVEITLIAEQSGTVTLPAGTIIATEGMDDQRLMIGRTIERTLERGERASMVVSAYCLDYERRPPTSGEAMFRIGVQRRLVVIHALGSRRVLVGEEFSETIKHFRVGHLAQCGGCLEIDICGRSENRESP